MYRSALQFAALRAANCSPGHCQSCLFWLDFLTHTQIAMAVAIRNSEKFMWFYPPFFDK
jgi:hypothetical protein